jgi:DNA-binding MarR family transcriptional regulator
MTVAADQPGLEQVRIAHEVGVDRATMANVIARLETRGLLRRTASKADKRLKLVFLTPKGRKLLDQIEAPAAQAHARTVAALGDAERAAFLRSLQALVDHLNEYGRAPLRLG